MAGGGTGVVGQAAQGAQQQPTQQPMQQPMQQQPYGGGRMYQQAFGGGFNNPYQPKQPMGNLFGQLYGGAGGSGPTNMELPQQQQQPMPDNVSSFGGATVYAPPTQQQAASNIAVGEAFDRRAMNANPQGFQDYMQQMQQREQQMPGSTMMGQQQQYNPYQRQQYQPQYSPYQQQQYQPQYNPYQQAPAGGLMSLLGLFGGGGGYNAPQPQFQSEYTPMYRPSPFAAFNNPNGYGGYNQQPRYQGPSRGTPYTPAMD